MEQINNWRDVADSARTTVGMEKGNGEPKDSWKRRMLLSEHSPIRKIKFSWTWRNIFSWVSVHFVRHKFGIEHWVKTQRTDRTNKSERGSQNALVNHECEANVQALINISRKRLCTCASTETRSAWLKVKNDIKLIDPVIAEKMVAECYYRGFCPEGKTDCLTSRPLFQKKLEQYRKIS